MTKNLIKFVHLVNPIDIPTKDLTDATEANSNNNSTTPTTAANDMDTDEPEAKPSLAELSKHNTITNTDKDSDEVAPNVSTD